MTSSGLPLDEAAVSAWLAHHLPEAGGGLSFAPIQGGRSNLTYLVRDGHGRRWVLRRPPVGAVAGAHDVLREARILTALAGSAVPVPRVVATCQDDAVTGAPFVLMDYVDAMVLRGPDDVAALPGEARAALIGRLVTALLALQAVDPDRIGLGDLVRRENYLSRQLRRWLLQSQREGCADMAALTRVHDALAALAPPQSGSALVHGDFRLENCTVDADGRIVAVLDWELCTLGDPLADVGLLLAYWAEPGDAVTALQHSPTLALGAGGRDEIRQRYCAAAGVPVHRLHYYEAFGWWKLACIVGGVHARISRGAVTMADRDSASFAAQAARLAAAAESTVDRLSPDTVH